MIVLDDYTNYVVVYLLDSKGDVLEKLKEYVLAAETKWNLRIHKLRCDNGGKYTSGEVKDWCKCRGI